MTVSENGLHSLQYNWKNIVPAAQTTTMKGPCVKTLSENEAIEKYCGEVNLKNLDVSSSISYRQVYLYQDNEVIPAWVFGTEDAVAVVLHPAQRHPIRGHRQPTVTVRFGF